MFAITLLQYEKHEQAFIVPWEAVVQLENSAFVFTVNNNEAHQVPVEVLKIFESKAEVKGNLLTGQLVILDGKFTVEDGDLVAVQK
jgi:multidrug efflux pump subunit AcrA (membrane-fusion protein)